MLRWHGGEERGERREEREGDSLPLFPLCNTSFRRDSPGDVNRVRHPQAVDGSHPGRPAADACKQAALDLQEPGQGRQDHQDVSQIEAAGEGFR